jgi:hypothetical protein
MSVATALPSVISITVNKSARVYLPVVNVGVCSSTAICHSIPVSEIIPEQDDMHASSNVAAAANICGRES